MALLAALIAAGPAVATSGPVGNATPRLDPIAPGTVAVVGASAPVRSRVAFVVQNGSERSVRVAKVVAVVASADGTQAARATTTDAVPGRLHPGEIAIGDVVFGPGSITPDSALTWRVTSKRAPSTEDPVHLDVQRLALSAPRSGRVAQTLELDAANPHARTLVGPIVATVLCLNEAGLPVQVVTAEQQRKRLRAAASVRVRVALRELCPSYVVAARAHLDR